MRTPTALLAVVTGVSAVACVQNTFVIGSGGQAGASGASAGGSGGTGDTGTENGGTENGGAENGGAGGMNGGAENGGADAGNLAAGGTNGGAENGTDNGGTDNSGADAGSEGGNGGAENGGAGGTSGGAGTGGAENGGAGSAGELLLMAPWDSPETCSAAAKETCESIPLQYRSDGAGGPNEMPLLSWTEGPEGTKSYALVTRDLSNSLVTWALWNLPADTTAVDANTIPEGSEQASHLPNQPTWRGPGVCDHVFELVLFALSVDEYLPDGTPSTVRGGLEGGDMDLVLARSSVRGRTQSPCD